MLGCNQVLKLNYEKLVDVDGSNIMEFEILRETPNLVWGMLASFQSCSIGEELRAGPGGQETSVLSWDRRDFAHSTACPHWCSAFHVTD